MEYELYSLIDITETGENHGPNQLEVGQQSNYNTLIQTLGLRANPNPKKIIVQEGSLKGLGLGSRFTGKHRYWIMTFDIEYGTVAPQDLEADLDLVPVVTNLTETVKILPAIFSTLDPQSRNCLVKAIDNN